MRASVERGKMRRLFRIALERSRYGTTLRNGCFLPPHKVLRNDAALRSTLLSSSLEGNKKKQKQHNSAIMRKVFSLFLLASVCASASEVSDGKMAVPYRRDN